MAPTLNSSSRLVLTLVGLTSLMIVVVGTSLYLAYQQIDKVTAERQAVTVQKAVLAQSHGMQRELLPETIWGDAYANIATKPDREWIRTFYGEYLSRLLGYSEIYVIDGQDRPVYGFEDGRSDDGSRFSIDSSNLLDLVAAVRSQGNSQSDLVDKTLVDLGDGHTIEHRSVADVRLIDGKPVKLVVSTIDPDIEPNRRLAADARAPLLIAISDLDEGAMDHLGHVIGFPGLRWIPDLSNLAQLPPENAPRGVTAPASYESTIVYSSNGKRVAAIAWERDLPGSKMLKEMTGGLTLAGSLVAAIALLTVLVVRRQARTLQETGRREAALARTDFLTQLPNRLAASEELARQLASLVDGKTLLGIVCLDLDRFKSLNDRLGRHVGDQALIVLSQQLAAEFPYTFLARTGGNEFVLFVPCGTTEHVDVVANRVQDLTARPFRLQGQPAFELACSVGYAIAPHDGTEGEDLMRRADLALYQAKKDGRPRAYAFELSMETGVARRLTLDSALRRALDHDKIDVVFQPLMTADGQRVMGVEALARWNDAELGPVSPTEFIAVAEDNGLIVDLGEKILRKAVRAIAPLPDIGVSVNVSARQIQLTDVVEVIRRIATEEGLPFSRLEIELTESALVTDEVRAASQIKGLQSLGVKLSIDDFGTGYASLLYLRQFGFDKLKIDRSFITDVDTSVEAQAMVMAIVTMAKSLDMGITAEGIENAEQSEFLRVAGCDRLQGYHFSRPLKAEDFTKFLQVQRQAA